MDAASLYNLLLALVCTAARLRVHMSEPCFLILYSLPIFSVAYNTGNTYRTGRTTMGTD
jgi:hypothetical protein